MERCMPPMGFVQALFIRQSTYTFTTLLVDPTAWLKKVAAAPLLSHLQIDFDTIVEDWGASAETFDMPLLRSLYLVSGMDNWWENINAAIPLDRIVAPSLEILMLRNILADDITMAQDTFPSLHTVIIWGVIGSWCVLLENLPSHVQHLVCGSLADRYEELLDELSYGDVESESLDGEDHAVLQVSHSEDSGVENGDQVQGASLDVVPGFSGIVAEGVGADRSEEDFQLYLPHLRTIAILPAAGDSFPMEATRELILSRKLKGRPLRKLYVPAIFLVEVFEWFPKWEGLVEVEVWHPGELTPGWQFEW
ncbi:hypothetical protein HWV62_2569 [Athelia sp. TMB]|nr:hypothetical protein HWV62_2569 [Athelia sp. TMB]